MADYISRTAVLSEKLCCGISCHECPFLRAGRINVCGVAKYIESIPAADVRPVVRGEWIQVEPNSGTKFLPTFRCSVCGILEYGKANFCFNCGADMRGEEDRSEGDRNMV